MLQLDGSRGEGGGQILRTSLALSLITGQPFRIDNLRARRPKPGLLRQHLAAVRAAIEIGDAEAAGATLGSSRLDFMPRRVIAGEHRSAGSATLVAQTVLPALLAADGPATLFLEGGTHNPFAPPFDFLARAFLPLLGRMGAQVEARLERPGFYPAGGGRMSVSVSPAKKLAPLELLERGAVRACRARAITARLPLEIARRELEVLAAELKWPRENLQAEEARDSAGPGNVVLLEVESEKVTEVFTGFGGKGKRAEAVAGEAASAAVEYLAAEVPVGPHLADQILIPLALAGGGTFVTLPLTSHSRTNLEVIQRFLPVRFRVEETGRGTRVEAGKG
jgi:RNA 3'-terminal phosphate cyclase (ATP)